jgi:hypothetical protein
MALSEVSNGSQELMCMSSVLPNWKQIVGGPTNSDLACTDIWLYANIKIQLTKTFQVTEKIKS